MSAGPIAFAQITSEAESVLGQKPQILAVIGTLIFLVFVIDLVRRRRLVERYALLWMAAATVLVVFAAWDGGLDWVADRLGIISPPNALFLIGLGTVFALALHFSVAFSRLSEETKILAQEVARLDSENRAERERFDRDGTNGSSPADSDPSGPEAATRSPDDADA